MNWNHHLVFTSWHQQKHKGSEMNLPQKPGAFAAASPALVFIFCLVCLGLTGAVPSSQNSQPHSMCCVGAPAHRAAFVALAGNRLDRGYPGFPLCVIVLSTSWRLWDFYYVSSIGTFTTKIKQMYWLYIYQQHHKSTTLFCRHYFPHLGPTRTPVPQCQNTCQTPSFLKDATAAIVSWVSGPWLKWYLMFWVVVSIIFMFNPAWGNDPI